jgi:hypothetical protein
MKTHKYAPPLLSALLIIGSCANQAPPSGGPEDKAPPAVVAQVPGNGQVNVDTRAAVEIRFSEWINRSSAAGAVSVYPTVPQGVTVRAKKNSLTVTPKAPLSGNTTYHVSVSAALQDLHGNAIARPIDIYFSTGAVLDSGRVEGAIVALKSKVAGQKVMLFWVDGGSSINNVDNQGGDKDSGWTDGRYFSPPNYAAQTDSVGAFGFSHIKEGRYRIVAFADQYRTGRLRVGDTCFTSLEKTVSVTKSPQTFRLYPAESDTSTVKKMSAADSAGVDTAVIDTSKNKTAADTAVVDTVNTSPKKPSVDTLGVIDTSKNKRAVDTAGVNAVKRKRIADSLCVRLSGGASCLKPNENRKWVYRPISRRDTSFTVADSAGTFAFDSIPASKGTLLWFIDDNGDNQITPGRLSPWRAPERFFAVPDTVEAKARWVVEGLEVRGCEGVPP